MIQLKRIPLWFSSPAPKPETAGVSAPEVPGRVHRWINRVPLFWRLQLGGWFLVEFMTLPNKFWFYGSIYKALLVLAIRLPVAIFFSTGLRWLYLRLRLTNENPWRTGGWTLAGSMGSALAEQIIVRVLQPPAVQETFAAQFYFGQFCNRALIYLAWSLLYFFIKSVIAERARMLRLAQAEAAAARAEIQMLRAQVNPHFLFNALNTILAGLDREPRALGPVVQGLASYLRYSMEHRHTLLVSLGDEFDATMHYLEVQKARFGDNLRVDCFMAANARSCAVPGVILQPLLENAFKYGYVTCDLPLRLSVAVTMTKAGGVRLEVANSGCWMESAPERGLSSAKGTGLENLRRRLDLLYPAGYHLEILTDDGWVRIRIELPPNPESGVPG